MKWNSHKSSKTRLKGSPLAYCVHLRCPRTRWAPSSHNSTRHASEPPSLQIYEVKRRVALERKWDCIGSKTSGRRSFKVRLSLIVCTFGVFRPVGRHHHTTLHATQVSRAYCRFNATSDAKHVSQRTYSRKLRHQGRSFEGEYYC